MRSIVGLLAVILGTVIILAACQPPAPSCFLIQDDAPRTDGSQIFDKVVAEFQRSLDLSPRHYSNDKWKTAQYSAPERVEISIYLHKTTGKIFLQFTQWDRKDNDFSEGAARLFEQLNVAMTRAAAPVPIRKSCKWRDIEKTFGDEVYSR